MNGSKSKMFRRIAEKHSVGQPYQELKIQKVKSIRYDKKGNAQQVTLGFLTLTPHCTKRVLKGVKRRGRFLPRKQLSLMAYGESRG